mmetsp:Transcript_14513/g.24083  ORF Transcript_14513/g.24083 Transcript_14513/m.24083 type:complete len:194 (+) Transcript_14513:230-811(+)
MNIKLLRIMLLVVLTILTMIAVAVDVHAVQKPSCATREFSQRKLRYGNLERKAGNSGKLSFKVDPSEVLHIFFRIHPRRVDNPGDGYDPYDVPSASSLSLARSLDALDDELRNRTTVSVFLNSENNMELQALWNWTNNIFHNRSLFIMIYECPLGNSESYGCMVQTLFQHHQEGLVQADDIVYLVEVQSLSLL